MTKKIQILLLAGFIYSLSANAQISPPGMGDSRLGCWSAFAIKQNLDTLDKMQLVVYAGIGRMSNPDDFNLFRKQGIVILNTEFYNQFAGSFQYSVALSYRQQNQYAGVSPFEKEDPDLKQEFRFYSRLSHLFETGRLKIVNTLRAECRTFFAPDFSPWNEDLQFRFRYRFQSTFSLDPNGNNRIILSAEPLFSISHDRVGQSWGALGYRESRLCFYFSHRFKNAPFIIDLGYMNNLILHKSVSYISMDIVWINPFENLSRKPVPLL